MGRKKNKKPIQVRVHYPTTKEGMDYLKEKQAEFIINILIKEYGEAVTDKIFERMKEKLEEEKA